MLMTSTNNHSVKALRRNSWFTFHVGGWQHKTSLTAPAGLIWQGTKPHTGLMHNWHLKYNSKKASGGCSSSLGGEDFVTSNFIFYKNAVTRMPIGNLVLCLKPRQSFFCWAACLALLACIFFSPFLLCFFANLMFLRNLGSTPLRDSYLWDLGFLMPFLCHLRATNKDKKTS